MERPGIPEEGIKLSERTYSVDFKGRIRNFSLAKDKALLPLFEAVVNSLQAIEDKNTTDGVISISLNRLAINQLEFEENADLPKPDITGFTIIDNGIGFNDENFESFLKADSQHKESRGGKGVGRFCWLKAYENVEISSAYQENEGFLQRRFNFNENSNGIIDSVVGSDSAETGTTVELKNTKREYQPFIPKDMDVIADSLMRHCLVYLLAENCPLITLYDGDESICVNEQLAELLAERSDTDTFNIKDNTFSLLHIKMKLNASERSRATPTNMLYLCANNRSVSEIKLNKQEFNGLDSWLRTNHDFVYMGILTSTYLDENVDSNRLAFTLPKSGEDLLFDVSEEEIISAAQKSARKFLDSYITQARKEQSEKVQQYIAETGPQYRHLYKYASNDLNSIKYGASDEEIEDALHKIKRKVDKENKNAQSKLLDKLRNKNITSEEYQEQFQSVVERASDANKAALAEYVAHRRAILDLLEHGIEINSDDKYEIESYIHELIYPMRGTSDDTSYGAHNLWLVDERLTYSTYISSDKPFNGDNKEKRPDLMCLDSPVFMFSEENHGGVYDSIILFELKRPMRDDYDEKDNPITQLLGYAEKISTGQMKDAKGRYIRVNENTRMYLYAVCDITPSLERILKMRGFKKTADGEGQYMLQDNYNAYIEVLPFDKMLKDSKMRNQVFFQTLGID